MVDLGLKYISIYSYLLPRECMPEVRSEVRVLQKIGSSLALYLPKDWCERNKLSKGSNVTLRYTDNFLCIDLGGMSKVESTDIVLNITSMPEDVLKYLILSFYIAGYDRVKLVSHKRINLPLRRQLLSILRYALKYNVIEEGENFLVIGKVGEAENMLEALKREFNTVITVFKYTMEALENTKLLDKYYEAVNELDDEVDRAQVEVERAAFKLIQEPFANVLLLRYVIPATIMSLSLERLSDHLVLLVKEVANGYKNMGELLDYLQKFSKNLQELHDILNDIITGKYDPINIVQTLSKLIRIVEIKRTVREDLSRTLNEPGFELVTYHIIRVYAIIADIAEALINTLAMIFNEVRSKSSIST